MDMPAILSDLNDHGFSDTTTTRKVAVVQDTIWQFEGLRPWPFLEKVKYLDSSAASNTFSDFPSDFRATVRLKDLTLGRRLQPYRAEDVEDMTGTQHAKAGDPELYFFEENNLKVWPVPTTAATDRFKLVYVRWSDAVTDTSAESAILLPKYFHRGIIVNGALSRLYDMEDDTELATRFEQKQQGAIAQAVEALWQRQYDRPDFVKVADPDSWDYLELT